MIHSPTAMYLPVAAALFAIAVAVFAGSPAVASRPRRSGVDCSSHIISPKAGDNMYSGEPYVVEWVRCPLAP